MSIVEMAKAHLQNVHARVEQLKAQKQSIEDEIDKLLKYIEIGLHDIEDAESADQSISVSSK